MLRLHDLALARAARVNAVCGGLLVLSGCLFLGAWLVEGGAWAGPVSLRKPILFGLSTGVTLLSLSWVILGLVPRRGDLPLYASLGVALVLEVFLIDLQQVRGVPSHYNRATPFDRWVLDAMLVLILWATVVIIEITVRSFRGLRLPPDEALAARAGLVLLVVGCLLGVAITFLGESRAAAGLAPETWGERGVLKFPHGIPLHGIQVLHVQVLLLRALGVGEPARTRSLWAAIIAIASATLYGVVQTGLGAPRGPPVGAAWLFVVATAVSALWAVTTAWVGKSAREPPS